jgi:hypothetical protein
MTVMSVQKTMAAMLAPVSPGMPLTATTQMSVPQIHVHQD